MEKKKYTREEAKRAIKSAANADSKARARASRDRKLDQIDLQRLRKKEKVLELREKIKSRRRKISDYRQKIRDLRR